MPAHSPTPTPKSGKTPSQIAAVKHLLMPFDDMLRLAVCGKLLQVGHYFVHKMWANCQLATTLRRRFLAYFFLPL